ncbi:MAG: hypothetical protein ACJAWV_000622 [Flammeovirgaceae bacterium]|jgi:hypothetical protein
MKKLLILSAFFLLHISVFAQSDHYLKIGTQIPLQYNIGYEFHYNQKWVGSLEVGIFTKPYDKMALGLMKNWGMDKNLNLVLEESFKYGWIVQPELGRNLGKGWYVGVFGQHIKLVAKDPSPTSVADYFGGTVFDLSEDNQELLDGLLTSGASLDIIGTLRHVGFHVGKSFQTKNPRLSIFTSLGLSSNINSQSDIEFRVKGFSNLQGELVDTIESAVNKELQDNYLKYAHIPVLSVKLRYRLGEMN